MKMRRFIIILTTILSFAANARAQVVAVNSDLLMDACMAPSFGVEFVTGNSTSISINGLGAYRPWNQDIRFLAAQPEFRYYLSRRTMYHHFIGVCATAASYKLDDGSKIYDGYGVGLGVTFGYVFSIGKRWNIDLHAGVQNFFYKQKEYWEGDRYDELWRNSKGRLYHNANGTHFLPTRIGASITYIIK